MVQLTCSNCGESWPVLDTYVEKVGPATIQCPKCSGPVRVPRPADRKAEDLYQPSPDDDLQKGYKKSSVRKLMSRDFAGALSDCDRAIELDPSDGVAYYNRGRVHAELGDLKRAIEDYSMAITLNPRDGSAYRDRGNAFLRNRRLSAALLDFLKALVCGGYAQHLMLLFLAAVILAIVCFFIWAMFMGIVTQNAAPPR